MRIRRTMLVVLAACSSVLLGAGAVSAAGTAAPSFGATTCSGGPIAPGTYQSLTVTGFCELEAGVFTILSGLTVAPGAFLDAASSAPTVTVTGGVQVGNGAGLLLGCSPPELGCPSFTSDHISGGIVANQALFVILHNNTINGGVSVQGGGGGLTGNPFCGFPFSDLEDNTINGGASISGLQSCWFGFIRNTVHGSVSITNNAFDDEDATEIVQNTISGNLACFGNSPAAQVGDSGGLPNIVTGQKLGECAAPGL